MKRGGLLVIAAVALLIGATAGSVVPAVPIPQQPSATQPPAFVGHPARARPVRSFRVPRHPFMAPNGRSNMHDDAYMTDAYAWAGPLGRDPTVTSTWLGLEECASVTFDRRGRIVALCGTADGARLRLLDPTTLETLSLMPLPPRSVRPGTTPLNDFCAAGYFYLDHQGRGVLSTNTNQVWVVRLSDAPSFELIETVDLVDHVPFPDCLASVLPDWQGRLWFASKGGIVGTIEPGTRAIQTVALPGEAIANSFATDETGGAFIVTDHALYRFDADPGTGAPSITWRTAYDRGARLKPGQLSQGSGTTPTLMGGGLVAITDNADPRMHVQVYRRGRRGGDLVCRRAVFQRGRSATDNSLIAAGRALIVENNYGYEGPSSTGQGATTTPGIARVDVDTVRGRCTLAWTSREVAPTTVPKVSLATGLVYVYAKPPRSDGVDAWYFTALDIRSGRTVFRRLTGTGYLFNNHYAPVSIGPDGAAYVGALGGLIRIADAA